MKLIDADALRERVLYRKKPRNHMDDEAGAYDRGFNAGIFAASKEIDSAPTISPDEVRGVGKWIKNYDRVKWWYECSCCHEKPLISRFGDTEILSTYCPRCGARMGGVQDALS